jgi:hypothetical protein
VLAVEGDDSVAHAFARTLVDLWTRDGIAVEAPVAVAERVTALFAAGGGDVEKATALLERTGVRAQWNDALRRNRAAALADRIRPLVTEPLLDVLAGDGSVCRALADLGVKEIAATERCGDYAESVLPPRATFRPFRGDLDLAQFHASTALVSTVLHHEPDPIPLLNALAQAKIPQWIVVENCITPAFSRPFHEFADRFFNTCLNEFGAPCGDEHRTLAEWERLLGRYGSVTIVDESFTVPGIPFPYSLLIVTRR